MPEPTKNLVSVGHLCQQFQRTYFDVLGTLDRSGVKPAMTLNLTPYYDFDVAYKTLESATASAPMIES